MENLVWQLEKAVEAQWEQAGTFLVTREPEKRHPCWTSMVVRLRSVDAAAGTCASLKSAENKQVYLLSEFALVIGDSEGWSQPRALTAWMCSFQILHLYCSHSAEWGHWFHLRRGHGGKQREAL